MAILPGDEPPEGSEANLRCFYSQIYILLKADTRSISHEQLVVEANGTRAGLVMAEAKYIDVDKRQSAAAQRKDPFKTMNLKVDHCQSLIALHTQLLHEHHDCFLALPHLCESKAKHTSS